ncbi:acyltransferase family protein [Leucobacter sp. NPDC077196]|uniref:acyltransferase family protein n=1 Tax=Leucobacter sp. NPDC077196 TaxID=3154959 RepID=UPI00342A0CDF
MTAPAPIAKKSSYRPEIEGLRALAIGLVLLYHAGVPFIRGGFVGVDIFFVISGFLITGILIRELETTGRIDLIAFWGRRAKRLLPASSVVLLFSAIGTWLIIPSTQWRSIGADIAAAAGYVVNWRFAQQAVDYNAEGTGVSPVKHFWSLAVEEQFYVVWPLLLVLLSAVVLKRVARTRIRLWIGIALAIIVIPSFIWSVSYTSENPSGAFFITTTRLWELGVGAAIAIIAPQLGRLPRSFALLLGWLGTSAIVISVFLFDGPTAWPGALALLPVLGTGAVIIATTGRDAESFGVERLLSWKPIVWIGGISYSWYLWHWPFLVLAEAQFGELRLRWSVLAVLLSGVVAWISLRLIENPVRRSATLAKNHTLAFVSGLNLTFLGIITGLALILATPGASTNTPVDLTKLGAASLATSPEGKADLASVDASEQIIPAPTDATNDMPPFNEECKTEQDSAEVILCEYGDTESDVTIVATGDSKIQQMESALIATAESQGWHLVTVFKSACALVEPAFDESESVDRNCAEWNRAAIERIIELDPAVVLTTGRTVRDGRTENGDETPGAQMIAGAWQRFLESGIAVVPLLDNPDPGQEVYECVAEHPDELSACSFEREEALARSGASYQRLAMELAGVTEFIDLSDMVCPVAKRCPAVIGDVLVYRQGSHLTDTYVQTLAKPLEERLAPLVEAVGG